MSLSSIVGLILSAQSAEAYDPYRMRWMCRATCTGIDLATERVALFGEAIGGSNTNANEAWLRLSSHCQELASAHGFGGNGYLVKGFQYSHSTNGTWEQTESWNWDGYTRYTRYEFSSDFWLDVTFVEPGEEGYCTQDPEVPYDPAPIYTGPGDGVFG